MIETKKVTVDDKNYVIGKLRVLEAQKILFELLSVCGGFLNKADVKENADNVQLLITGISGIIEKLEPDKLIRLTKDLFGQVQYESEANKLIPLLPIFESHFQGRLFSMYELLYKCLEFNFEDFFLKVKNIPQLQGILSHPKLKMSK